MHAGPISPSTLSTAGARRGGQRGPHQLYLDPQKSQRLGDRVVEFLCQQAPLLGHRGFAFSSAPARSPSIALARWAARASSRERSSAVSTVSSRKEQIDFAKYPLLRFHRLGKPVSGKRPARIGSTEDRAGIRTEMDPQLRGGAGLTAMASTRLQAALLLKHPACGRRSRRRPKIALVGCIETSGSQRHRHEQQREPAVQILCSSSSVAACAALCHFFISYKAAGACARVPAVRFFH
ncbi:hypothetical protein ACU4GD_28355 [Cupriavidus basilensis]